jgi:Putative 2OG-Fe(II) oxygenase
MGEFHQIFAPFYWKTQVTESQEILDRCLGKIETCVEKKPVAVPTDWECIIHSSYMSNDPEMQLDGQWLNSIYTKYISTFFDELKIQRSAAMLFDPWYNVFSHNQFQEPHAHFPNDFSVVHYVLFDDKEHQATTFVNPNPTAAEAQMAFRPQLVDKLNKKSAEHSFYMTHFTPTNIKQGDLIIFPASLSHFVKHNKSDKKRITFTLNIQMA